MYSFPIRSKLLPFNCSHIHSSKVSGYCEILEVKLLGNKLDPLVEFIISAGMQHKSVYRSEDLRLPLPDPPYCPFVHVELDAVVSIEGAAGFKPDLLGYEEERMGRAFEYSSCGRREFSVRISMPL